MADPLFELPTEETLLGNMILDPSAIEIASGIVCGSDFGEPDNGRLFDALVTMRRAGLPTGDPVVLVPELRRMRGLPESVTSGLFIADLIRNGVRFNETFYAKRIKELSNRRKLISIAEQIHKQALDPIGTSSDIARRARAALDGLGCQTSTAVVNIAVVAAAVVEDLRQPKSHRNGGATFGIPAIDLMLGRMCPGELWILAARPGNGKTSLALQIGIANAIKQRRVLVASLEMTAAELATREICGDAGIDSRRLRAGDVDADDIASLQLSAESLRGLPLDIWAPAFADIAAIRATALLSAARGDLGLVAVDYISRIVGKQEKSWERIGEQSAALKSLAREVQAPVLVLSQFNRDAATERPSLAMLRYSGAIEQDADCVMALHPVDESKSDFELIVLKNRHGESGSLFLTFDGLATRFSEREARFQEFDQHNTRAR